jgi:hypothetical protein
MAELGSKREYLPEQVDGKEHVEVTVSRFGWIFPLVCFLASQQVVARND